MIGELRDPLAGRNVKRLETRDGVLRYVRDGGGLPVILVQGVGVIGEGWRPQMAALRDRYSMVAPDNRGIGGSSLGSDTLTKVRPLAGRSDPWRPLRGDPGRGTWMHDPMCGTDQ